MSRKGSDRPEATDFVAGQLNQVLVIGSGAPFYVQLAFVVGGDRIERGGEHGQGDVPVPGVVTADLVVVQLDLVLGELRVSSMLWRLPATRTSSATGTGWLLRQM